MVSAIANGPAAAAPRSSRGETPRNVAARVAALIREDSSNLEIVTFADRRLPSVKVVRGTGRLAAPPPRARATPVRSTSSGTVEIMAFADRAEPSVTVLRGSPAMVVDADLFASQRSGGLGLFVAASGADLDRVAFAVDGAESSHGADPAMWRPEPDGPEGPMQVSAAAAVDSGGGDRFDPIENRLLGRAYLALLYRRYGNWPDAIAAYNWGPGNMDAWIGSGRPAVGLPLEVEHYRDRVLRDSGMRPAPGTPATERELIEATSVRGPEK
ncbi:MAG: lytic transglycosylase domain-containing protein [Stellaceae bacterium]